MKRVRVTKRYNDVVLGRKVFAGEEYDMEDDRAEFLLEHPSGLVELVNKVETEPEPVEKPAVKKSTGTKTVKKK